MSQQEPLPVYVRRKSTELVEVLVRDFGVSNSLELREEIYGQIGSVVVDILDRNSRRRES